MAAKKRGLGRGLEALMGAAGVADAAPTPAADSGAQSELRKLPIEKIQRGRYQPRRDFDQAALEELAASISKQGLMQPIVVRPIAEGRFEIIAGERRWRAVQIAGMAEIPALVREIPDEAAIAMALIENIQRENLNAIEEAVALSRLQQEFGLTHEQIAEAVGKSRTAVTNALRLLGLNAEVRAMLESGQIEMGHGRALLGLPGDRQTAAARQVADKSLNVRQTEALVKSLLTEPSRPANNEQTAGADIRQLERELSEKIGASLSISHSARGKGKLVITYSSLDELEGILAHIR